MLFIIGAIAIATSPTVCAESDYTQCDKAYVPCPRAPGFQFFNRTCYGIIRDTLAFGAADSYFKCESGMHLSFSDPSMSSQKLEQRTAMDRRMTLARVTGLGTLNVLSKLRRQVVPDTAESTLVDLTCSEDCRFPGSWMFSGSEAFPTRGRSCADTAACNWQGGGRSVWAHPPGTRPSLEHTADQPVNMPALNNATHVHTDEGIEHTETVEDYADADIDTVPLRNRLAVLVGQGALRDVPETINLHSLACEIPFSTTDEEIQQLLPLGLAIDADMSLHAQMVHDLSIASINDSRTHVRLTWRPPHCPVTEFYLTVQSDSDQGERNRSKLLMEDVCDEAAENCQIELDLPLCSLLYIEVGAVLGGEDAAPDVVQWQTPAPEDPLIPEAFFLSEISGSVVTLTWEIAEGRGPCQPYHEVTVQGHGKVTLKPGVTELKADLDDHCEHFNAYVKATILGRSSGIRGPIHGVTGPTAPEHVHVVATASTWASLEWSHQAAPSSPCIQANYRVTCRPLPTTSAATPPPAVSVTSPVERLNVTGLVPGVRYRCGVCALASLMDTSPSDTALRKPPCGGKRFVDLTTNETIPGTPYDLNITETSHNSLTLQWRRPEEPNGVIVRYNISMTCEPQTFPLCTSDPLCVDRWFDVPLEGNDTDHVTFTMTGLQAARLHHVTVAAATAVGQGPFSLVFSADTRVGVPPPPSHVSVTSQVKRTPGFAEQTSVSVSLHPPCPFPGVHHYRLQFDSVDFLAGYRSTVRAAMLTAEEIRELYSGNHNISFSVFDGKWTPGFEYEVRIVAHTNTDDLEEEAHVPSEPVKFVMTVPPPGVVRHLTADCTTHPLRPSYSWANPTTNAFGIVGYRTVYHCRHPVTGHEVSSGGWSSCHHSECPCVSSQSRSNQCSACERVCNYPVKSFNFMGEKTYYFNCTCEKTVEDAPVMPGSECRVMVQAESKYLQQHGEVTRASCQTPEYTVHVTELKVSCNSTTMTVSWDVPKPMEVPTSAYHVDVQHGSRDSVKEYTFVKEKLGESQCDKTRCQAAWSGLQGDVTYIVRVAAESVYSTPAVGPAAESYCLTPARVPLPPPESVQKQLAELSGWREDLDPSRQYLLMLPNDLYDVTSGTLREVRVVVFEPEALNFTINNISNMTTDQLPHLRASGNITELPQTITWRQFQTTNGTAHYQASPPAFVLDPAGSDPAEFILGGNLSCSENETHLLEASHCNGPLRPNTSYAVQLLFVNDVGFSASRPFIFRTKSVREAELEKAERTKGETETGQDDQKTDGTATQVQPSTDLQSPTGTSGSSTKTGGGLPKPKPIVVPAEFARSGDGATPADSGTSEAPTNGTTALPEEGVSVGTAVGASMGALGALVSAIVGFCLWKRRSGSGS